ncbi:MAG TPA: hypothetical protein VFN76_09810 [Candidatus Limnocylindria bacterium]|nr:hypothetical protein [Candidatus Limnocylindria bacterium]
MRKRRCGLLDGLDAVAVIAGVGLCAHHRALLEEIEAESRHRRVAPVARLARHRRSTEQRRQVSIEAAVRAGQALTLRLADALADDLARMPVLLRSAIVDVCRAPGHPVSVAEIARASAMCRRTVDRALEAAGFRTIAFLLAGIRGLYALSLHRSQLRARRVVELVGVSSTKALGSMIQAGVGGTWASFSPLSDDALVALVAARLKVPRAAVTPLKSRRGRPRKAA